MSNQIKTMYQIKEIYRLSISGISQRKIAVMLNISRKTVKSYLKLLHEAGKNLEEIANLTEVELMSIVTSIKQRDTPLQDARHNQLATYFSHVEKELKRTGVTLQILWEEYKFKNSEGYSYVQFCFHYRNYFKRSKASLHFEHVIGECLMVDYAGDKISYVNKETGEIIECQVLVTVLPYSGYTYAIAMHTQSQPDFVQGMNTCLKYMGGVPKNILSDNLKTVVIPIPKMFGKIENSV